MQEINISTCQKYAHRNKYKMLDCTSKRWHDNVPIINLMYSTFFKRYILYQSHCLKKTVKIAISRFFQTQFPRHLSRWSGSLCWWQPWQWRPSCKAYKPYSIQIIKFNMIKWFFLFLERYCHTAIEGSVRIQYTCLVPIYVFPEFRNRIIMFCLSISTFMYLWAIYILPGSVCLFCCSQTGSPILWIY